MMMINIKVEAYKILFILNVKNDKVYKWNEAYFL